MLNPDGTFTTFSGEVPNNPTIQWLNARFIPNKLLNPDGTIGLFDFGGGSGGTGTNGYNGWSPVFALLSDGDRIVLQVSNWTGGTGNKPASGVYLGATGFVTNIAQAKDIRGLPGQNGIQGIDGADGFSPIVNKIESQGITVLEITDVNGKITTQNLVGEKGQNGDAGQDAKINGYNILTIIDGQNTVVEINPSTQELQINVADASGLPISNNNPFKDMLTYNEQGLAIWRDSTVTTPTVLWVDVNNDDLDNLENGSINFPYSKIQTAIDRAPFGATIKVFAGTYNESIVIHNKSNITLTTESTLGQYRVVVNGTFTISGNSQRIGIRNFQFNGDYNFTAMPVSGQGGSLIFIDNISVRGTVNLSTSGYHRYDDCFFMNVSVSGSTFADFRSCQCEDNSTWEVNGVGATLSCSATTNPKYVQTNGSLISNNDINILPVGDNVGIKSTSDNGVLWVNNLNFLQTNLTYASIQKTGNCPCVWGLNQYDPNNSVLNGLVFKTGIQGNQVFSRYEPENYLTAQSDIDNHLEGIDKKIANVDTAMDEIKQNIDNIVEDFDNEFIRVDNKIDTNNTDITNSLNTHISNIVLHLSSEQIALINLLVNARSNIQSQIDNLNNQFNNSYIRDTFGLLDSIPNLENYDIGYVRVDETKNDNVTMYLRLNNVWEYISTLSPIVRNFLVDKLDIITESKGVLSENRIDSLIARKSYVNDEIERAIDEISYTQDIVGDNLTKSFMVTHNKNRRIFNTNVFNQINGDIFHPSVRAVDENRIQLDFLQPLSTGTTLTVYVL